MSDMTTANELNQPSLDTLTSNQESVPPDANVFFGRPIAWFWGLMAICTVPFMFPYFFAAWNQEHFQYIPLVPIVVFGLAYTRFDGIVTPPSGRFAKSCLGLAVFFFIIAAMLRSSWLGAFGVIFLTLSFLQSLKQDDDSSLLYLAIPFLLFIRLPQLRAQALIVRLQRTTTDLSSVILDFVGVPNFVQGNTISLADKQLFVDEACSGVRSLFTLMFFALALLVYRKRSVYLTPLMLAVGIVLAVFGNVIRVTTISLAQAWFEYDLATGFQHDLLGHGTLLLSLGLMLSADRLIESVFHSIDRGGETSNPLISLWNFFFTPHGESGKFSGTARTRVMNLDKTYLLVLKASAGIAIVVASWMTIGKTIDRLNRNNFVSDSDLIFEPSPDLVTQVNAPISLVSHQTYRNGSILENARLGKNADIYTCSIAQRPGEIVISQPYVGWHELTVCYRGLGWVQKRRREVSVPGTKPVVVADFVRGDGGLGYLFFTAMNADGSTPISLGSSRLQRWLSPFIPTLLDAPAEITGIGETTMIQYWHVTNKELSQDEISEIAGAIAAVRGEIRDSLVSN